MKRFSLTFLLVVLWPMFGFGQELKYGFPHEGWHQGSVMFNDDKVFEGVIKYDLESDIVHFNVGGEVRVYSAGQIKTFSFFQKDIKKNRVFHSLPFATKNGYKRPKLFELIYEGKMSFLVREFLSVDRYPKSDRPTRRNVVTGVMRYESIDYELYLADESGEVIPIKKRRKRVIEALGSHEEQVRTFIKQNKLRMSFIEDLTKLMVYYNSLL